MLAAAVRNRDVHVPGLGHGEGGLCLHAEFAHGLAVALEVDFAAVGDGEAALLAGDFELVHAGGLTGGGDKGGGGTVVVLQHCGDIVFDFDLMEAAELAEAADLLWHAEHPLEEIKVMRALVHEHAAALALPGAAPAASGVVVVGSEPVGNFPVHATHGAELATVDEVFDFLEAGIRAHVEHGGEDFRFICVRGDESLAVGLVDGNRFFDEHVKPSTQGLDPDGGVAEMRCADEDGIDEPTRNHLGNIGEGRLSILKRWNRSMAFAESGDFQAGNFTGANVCEVGFAHVAEADDTKSDGVHR